MTVKLKAVQFEEVEEGHLLFLNTDGNPEIQCRKKVHPQVHKGVEINNFFMGANPEPAGSWISRDVIVYVHRT